MSLYLMEVEQAGSPPAHGLPRCPFVDPPHLPLLARPLLSSSAEEISGFFHPLEIEITWRGREVKRPSGLVSEQRKTAALTSFKD